MANLETVYNLAGGKKQTQQQAAAGRSGRNEGITV